MTKKELNKIINEFMEAQDDIKKDEWYCITNIVMSQFIDFIKNYKKDNNNENIRIIK